MIDPQQELFTSLRSQLVSEYGEDMVCDNQLPPDGTPYPFIYIGEMMQDDSLMSKDYRSATCSPTIHIYHNDSGKRGTVSAMVMTIKMICYSTIETGTYAWLCDTIHAEILSDNTTAQPLLHAVIQPEYKLLGGTTNV